MLFFHTFSDKHCTWHDDQLANSHYARNCSSSQSQPRSLLFVFLPGKGGQGRRTLVPPSLLPWIPPPPRRLTSSPLALSHSHALRCSGRRRRRCSVLRPSSVRPRFPFFGLICHEAGEREREGAERKVRCRGRDSRLRQAGGQFSQSEHERFFGQKQTSYPKLCIPSSFKY